MDIQMNIARAPIVMKPSARHTATLLFFHGRGDTGDGWASIFKYNAPSRYIKYVFPHAAVRPNSVAFGEQMPAWWDVYDFNMKKFDETGIRMAVKQVHDMLRDEIMVGIRSERIVVAGFSQGGALALYSALTFDKPLAGVAALSCYLPMPDKFPNEFSAVNRSVPIFQTHGDCDILLRKEVTGDVSSEILKKLYANHNYKIYDGMGHDVNEEALDDMLSYLDKWTPTTDSKTDS